MTAPRMLSTHRLRPLRGPSTLPGKALWRSTAKSSISPSGMYNSGFDLAKSLAGAKNLSEMVELQAAYWQKLLGALTSQAEEVRVLSTKLTADAAERDQVANRARRGRAGALSCHRTLGS